MNHIWLVKGNTGDYADYVEWNVKAFADKKSAEAYRKLCQEVANNFTGIMSQFSSPYDPKARMDYRRHPDRRSTEYTIEKVPWSGGTLKAGVKSK